MLPHPNLSTAVSFPSSDTLSASSPGASYVHYFLADTAVSTPELSVSSYLVYTFKPDKDVAQVYYTEKMAYLPATFYANSYRYDQGPQATEEIGEA
eukprot:755589-Hanusia_phi.AAC.2